MSFHGWAGPIGLAPSVFAHKHGVRDRSTWAVGADNLGQTPSPVPLEHESRVKAPRHADRFAWWGDGAPWGRFFVVSTLVHKLLEAARLPRHLVKPAQIRFAAKHHVKYGAAKIEAFLYSFSDADLIDVFDLRQTVLSCTVRLLSERPQHDVRLAAGTVDSGAAAFARAATLTPAGMRPWVTPVALHGDIDFRDPKVDFSSRHFPLHIKDLDLVFFDHFDAPLVSDGLRDALERCRAQGMTFSEPWDSARVVVVDGDPSRAADLLALAAGMAPKKTAAKTATKKTAQKSAQKTAQKTAPPNEAESTATEPRKRP